MFCFFVCFLIAALKVHLFDLLSWLVKCKMQMERCGGCSQKHGSYNK